MLDGLDHHTARALLEWHLELGVDEAIGDRPIDRYAHAETASQSVRPATHAAPEAPHPGNRPVTPPAETSEAQQDPVAVARAAAAAAPDLAALHAALAAFELGELKRGARSTVFADGRPEARIMIIGEAPGRDEDIEGRPFVGRAGQMLDRMFAAIGLARDAPDPDHALYITNILPWRPPQNRRPERAESAMLLPFVERHVALAAPELLVLMGNTPCGALLGRDGITRIRGRWSEVLGVPALPMFHPSYLLRTPSAKRDAWADLLTLQARLRGAP